MNGYRIPIGRVRVEHIVSNSRFIATADRASSVDEAKALLREIREEMPDATHHVYAFQVGHGKSVTEGMSDDGEPSGTAGPPALAVVRGADAGLTQAVGAQGGRHAEAQGLAQEAAGVGVVAVQRAVRVVASQIARAGTDQAEIGQAEARRQFALIGQRLREQHPGLQEQHRRGAVDFGHHVQQDRRVGAEGRDQRDAAAVLVADRVLQQDLRLRGGVNAVQNLRIRMGAEAAKGRSDEKDKKKKKKSGGEKSKASKKGKKSKKSSKDKKEPVKPKKKKKSKKKKKAKKPKESKKSKGKKKSAPAKKKPSKKKKGSQKKKKSKK